MQAAVIRGDTPPEWKPEAGEDDEMGDSFSIAGDTHVYQQPPPAPQQKSGMSDMVKGGLIAAALAAGPALGYWAANQRQEPQKQQQATPDAVPPWHLYPGYQVHPPEEE